MDPTSEARQPRSGPQRRTRSSRASLTVPLGSSAGAEVDEEVHDTPATPAKSNTGQRSTGAASRGSPYARPTPSPQTASTAQEEPASTAAPSLFSSLIRGALGTIGWGSSPSKKDSAPTRASTADAQEEDHAKDGNDGKIGSSRANTARPSNASGRTPARASSVGPSRLTTSRSLSHLAPTTAGQGRAAPFAPSPLRGRAAPPSVWPNAGLPQGVPARPRTSTRALSRERSPALTNTSARRPPSLYGYAGTQRPFSMVTLSNAGSQQHPIAVSEFGGVRSVAGGGAPSVSSPRRLGGASFALPNLSPFAAPEQYRASSAASSRGNTPDARSLAPAGSVVAPGYAPSPLGGYGGAYGRRSMSRAGSVAESVGSVYTAGGTPLRRSARATLNLSHSAVRRTPSVVGVGRSSRLSGGRGVLVGGLSEGEAMLEDYLNSAEGEDEIERMSVTGGGGGSRAATPAFSIGVGGGPSRLTSGFRAGSRNRSVAPSPSPVRAAVGSGIGPDPPYGRLPSVAPSRGKSPSVGQKRRADSVQGEAWERMSSLSIEPSRKKQVVWNEQERRYMTLEQMRALQPQHSVPRNAADRILNELEGVRTPLGDAQVMARRAMLTGAPLPAHVAVPEPRVNITAAKAIANRMLPPAAPSSRSGAGSANSVAKPIGPYARRQALSQRLAERRRAEAAAAGVSGPDADEDGDGDGAAKANDLREQVAAIRARDGLGSKRAHSARLSGTVSEDQRMAEDDKPGQDAAPADEDDQDKSEAEEEPSRKRGRKQSDRAPSADVDMGVDKPEEKKKEAPADAEAAPADTGSRRTLRPRKAKTPAAEVVPDKRTTEAPSKGASTKEPAPASKEQSSQAPTKSTAEEAPSTSAASSTVKTTTKTKTGKADAFQVLADNAVRPNAGASSLRQRSEKTSRRHEKSAVGAGGRFGLDDDDDDDEDGAGEDEVTAEDLQKIQAPKILFPAGFKFGGGAATSTTPTTSAPAKAPVTSAPSTSTSLFGSSAPSSSSASTFTPALKAPAVDLPALPPPTDAKPVTSLFDRIGKAPMNADGTPKKTVSFSTPVSSVKTFEVPSSSSSSSASEAVTASGSTSASATDSSASASGSAAPALKSALSSSGGFQFKLPTSSTPVFGGPKPAAVPGASDFFSKPPSTTETSKADTAAPASTGSVPTFFASSLQKREGGDKTSTAASTTAASEGSKVPNFFASSLNKTADKAESAGAGTATGTAAASTSGVPNFFASSLNKAGAGDSSTPSASADAGASSTPAISSSSNAMKAFAGFGAPSSTGSESTSSSATAAPAKPLFGGFGTAATTPASTSTSTTSTSTSAAAGPSKPLFGGFGTATPNTSTTTGAEAAKPLFGGFEAPASTAGVGTSTTSTSTAGTAAPKFSFGGASSATTTTTPASSTPAPATTLFGGFGSGSTSVNGNAPGGGGSNSMDTSSASPPKPAFGGFSFGGGGGGSSSSSSSAVPTAAGGGANTGPGTSTSLFGTGGTSQSGRAPFGQPASSATSTPSLGAGFVFGAPKPSAGGSASATGSSASMNPFGGGGTNGVPSTSTSASTTASPFAFGGSGSGAASSTSTMNGFGTLNSGGAQGGTSQAPPSLTLNAKPNFNFGAGGAGGSGALGGGSTTTPGGGGAAAAAPGSGLFTFGSGGGGGGGGGLASGTPSASTTPTVAPAQPAGMFTFGGGAGSTTSTSTTAAGAVGGAPSSSSTSPFVFGAPQPQQQQQQQQQPAPPSTLSGGFQFGAAAGAGAGAGAGGAGSSAPASPFLFGGAGGAAPLTPTSSNAATTGMGMGMGMGMAGGGAGGGPMFSLGAAPPPGSAGSTGSGLAGARTIRGLPRRKK